MHEFPAKVQVITYHLPSNVIENMAIIYAIY